MLHDRLTLTSKTQSLASASTAASPVPGEEFSQTGEGALVASYGVDAVLQAPNVSFPSSPALMYNWIGDQNSTNGGNLNQIGIFDNVGDINCTVTNEDVIVAEEMVNGTYEPATCYPQFVLQPGASYYFFTYWYASYGAWVDFVYYNNTWQGVVGYSMPQLPGTTTANQTAIDAVVNEGYYPVGGSPYTFSDDADVLSYFTDASLDKAVWPSGLTYQFTGQSSGSPYCLQNMVGDWLIQGTYC